MLLHFPGLFLGFGRCKRHRDRVVAPSRPKIQDSQLGTEPIGQMERGLRIASVGTHEAVARALAHHRAPNQTTSWTSRLTAAFTRELEVKLKVVSLHSWHALASRARERE